MARASTTTTSSRHLSTVVVAVLISSTTAISILVVADRRWCHRGACEHVAAMGELRFPLYICLRSGAS
jgi:hypothetical protein